MVWRFVFCFDLAMHLQCSVVYFGFIFCSNLSSLGRREWERERDCAQLYFTHCYCYLLRVFICLLCVFFFVQRFLYDWQLSGTSIEIRQWKIIFIVFIYDSQKYNASEFSNEMKTQTHTLASNGLDRGRTQCLTKSHCKISSTKLPNHPKRNWSVIT